MLALPIRLLTRVYSKCGFADEELSRVGLPTSRELLQVWREKRPKIVNYLHLTMAATLNWDELPDYLRFCEAGGVTVRRERELRLRPGSYEELFVYASARTAMEWSDTRLADPQRKALAGLQKSWTECANVKEYEETVAPEYWLLLKLVSDVLAVRYYELLRRIFAEFEHKRGLFTSNKPG